MALRIIIYIDVLCVYYFQIIDSILCFRILFLTKIKKKTMNEIFAFSFLQHWRVFGQHSRILL